MGRGKERERRREENRGNTEIWVGGYICRCRMMFMHDWITGSVDV